MIPRHELPQIPKEQYKKFIDFLKNKGVDVAVVGIKANRLKPIQSHVNRDKVEKFKDDPKTLKTPLISSKGGYILDGHHRWIASKELNPDKLCPVILVDCGIGELIKLGHEFDGSFTKSVYEATTYGKRAMENEVNDMNEKSLIVKKFLKYEG